MGLRGSKVDNRESISYLMNGSPGTLPGIKDSPDSVLRADTTTPKTCRSRMKNNSLVSSLFSIPNPGSKIRSPVTEPKIKAGLAGVLGLRACGDLSLVGKAANKPKLSLGKSPRSSVLRREEEEGLTSHSHDKISEHDVLEYQSKFRPGLLHGQVKEAMATDVQDEEISALQNRLNVKLMGWRDIGSVKNPFQQPRPVFVESDEEVCEWVRHLGMCMRPSSFTVQPLKYSEDDMPTTDSVI